jgi:hypothetical protein
VITTPSTAGSRSTSFTRFASVSQILSFMSWLPTFATCSPLSFAILSRLGTALIRSSTLNWPEV